LGAGKMSQAAFGAVFLITVGFRKFRKLSDSGKMFPAKAKGFIRDFQNQAEILYINCKNWSISYPSLLDAGKMSQAAFGAVFLITVGFRKFLQSVL
jgi:hypothetical protein